MGRLFWKFFLFMALAQLTAVVGVGGAIWLTSRALVREAEQVGGGPRDAFAVDAAAATLRYGGADALRSLEEASGDPGRPRVYAVDESGRELLGRPVAAAALAAARRLAGTGGERAVARILAADGHDYILFVAEPGRPPGGPRTGPSEEPPGPPGALPGPPGPPAGLHHHPGEPGMPWLPLGVGVVACLVFAGLLAWYFSKPIRGLRTAFDAAAGGNLDVRVGPGLGGRQDELADLGRDFDRMAARLRALMDSQRRLLHDVSHELRSPLARLQAAIGLARQQPEKLEASMERIERESVRIDRLVGELLTLSRLEAGVPGTPEEDVDLAELVAGIAEDAGFEAGARGCSVEFAGGGDIVLKGRGALLHQAVENVVRNAVKHAAPGTVVGIEAALEDQGRQVRLAVLDRGPGVAAADLQAIFEPFYRSGGQGSDGHGLGLAIARRVVELHGGSIGASNRPGGGLRVDMVLPLRPGARAPSAGPQGEG